MQSDLETNRPDVSQPLAANRPDVIDESFEGEITIIHLGTGLFYGLDACASSVWLHMRDGRRPDTTVAALAQAYDQPSHELEPHVLALVDQLCAQGLLVPCDDEGPDAAVTASAAWREPTMQQFTDMQDLLLLDPVHDIELDENGWPIPRVKSGEAATT